MHISNMHICRQRAFCPEREADPPSGGLGKDNKSGTQ